MSNLKVVVLLELDLRCLGETSVDFECLLIMTDLEVGRVLDTTVAAAVDTSQQLLAAGTPPAKLPGAAAETAVAPAGVPMAGSLPETPFDVVSTGSSIGLT